MFAAISAAGFGALDLWLAHLNWRWATPEHVRIARDSLDRHGLRVVSLAGNLGATAAELESACRLANALDVDLLGGMGDVLRNDLPGAVSVLRDHGVRFGYENHPEKSPQEVLALIGDADDVLGAAVDTGWWATQGYDPVQALRDLNGRLFHVHLKDVEEPGTHISCMHGDGLRRDRRLRRRASRLGYQGALTVEHEPFDRDPTEEVIRMRRTDRGAAGCSAERPHMSDEPTSLRVRRLRQHLRALRRDGEGVPESVEIAGATDVDPALSAAFVERFGGVDYPSLEALLDDPTVDAVVNLTSHGVHAQVTAAALEAGKHVHSEKPMAGSYAEARGLVELADASGVRLSCSPITFMGDAQETAWGLVDSGAIGTRSRRLR